MSNTNNNPGCLGYILKMFGLLPKEIDIQGNKFPYAQRDDFLSVSEFSFYKILDQVIDKRYIVCPKVGLQDVFFVTERDRSKHATYLNKINRKHVDFLICDRETMRPIFGIELDDSSHQRQDRMDRDDFVNELFKSAGLHLIRINNKKTYTISEITEMLKKPIDSIKEEPKEIHQETLSAQSAESESPVCKKCGNVMVVRITSKGEHNGKSFYGCSNFPKCRETLDIL